MRRVLGVILERRRDVVSWPYLREYGYHKRQDRAIGRSVPIGPFFAPPSDKRSAAIGG